MFRVISLNFHRIRTTALLVFASILVFLPFTWSHGYLIEPANRASLWRINVQGAPVVRKDDELYCGGFQRQWNMNDGKCGLCGDDYSLERPRPYENMGAKSRGVVVRTYEAGATIPVVAKVTDNHKGYFEFHLCPLEDPWSMEAEDCFDHYPLQLAKGKGYRYYLKSYVPGDFTIFLVLPSDLTCERCVLRWQYISGNNLGKCENGTILPGCGPQETFRSCSDVAILPQFRKKRDAPENSPLMDLVNDVFMKPLAMLREVATGSSFIKSLEPEDKNIVSEDTSIDVRSGEVEN